MKHDWRDEAACSPQRLERPVPFFYGAVGYDEKACKRICSRCAVAAPCLDTAMQEESEWRGIYRFGVRGGLTAAERTRLSLEQARYAIYPEDFTEVEVFSIFEEVVAHMKVQFIHPVDGFERLEEVELSSKLVEHYVSGGHAKPLEVPKTTKRAPKVAASEQPAEAEVPAVDGEAETLAVDVANEASTVSAAPAE